MITKKLAVILLLIILILMCTIYVTGFCRDNPKSSGSITVLAGTGTMLAMNDLKQNFEKENPGATVNIQYGNSGELFAKLNTDKNVDAVVPGDINFMENAKNKGFIDNKTVHSIVYHIPIIAVEKGNPKKSLQLQIFLNPT